MTLLPYRLSSIPELMRSGRPPQSDLELVDLILSGSAEGPLADLVLQEHARCEALNRSKEIRTRALSRIEELVKLACDNVEENKGHCHLAGSSEKASEIISDLVGRGKVVMKSFSWTLEEISIGRKLSAENEVLDVSVPGLILGLAPTVGEHVLMDWLKNEGYRLEGSISTGLRDLYRRKLYEANFGLTGVSALAADPGAMAIVHPSGLDRLVGMTPEVHIAVVGVEEIVESYDDAFTVAKEVSRALGGAYISFIGGPSKTGDIEKRVTYGAHGPREFHVIILDDGRTEAVGDEDLRSVLEEPRASALPCADVWPAWRRIIGIGQE